MMRIVGIMNINKMKKEMEEELVSNILPFWMNRMTDLVNGGFSRYHILFRKSSVYKVYIMVFT